jgi:twitching motility two-component system response regulator PilG
MGSAAFHLHRVALAPWSGTADRAAQHGRIMIIDDSTIVRKIIEVCLEREGFTVTGFANGIEALRWLCTPGAIIPNLIILDIGLPGLNGFEIARRLKSRPVLSQIPLVMLTRYDGMLNRLKGRLAGAREYLTKPFKTEDILSVVKRCL